MKLIDITGNRYGKLTVLNRAGCDSHKRPLWKCKCDCGNTVFVRGEFLRYGNTKSCGCSKHESKTITHNMSKSRLYSIWHMMKSRCYNKNNVSYKHYGEKGIIVCDAWKNSFEQFRDWSINNGYSDELTIDRIDVNGNYEPDNCRWSTVKEQNNNRTVSLMFTYMGKTQNLSSWCEELNLPYNKTWQRIVRRGYTFEEAISLPDYNYKRHQL